MMSLVTTRKRKDVDGAKSSSNEKSKVRLIEHSSGGCLLDGTPAGKPQRGVRTLNNIRQRGVKIMSVFRTRGTSLYLALLWHCLIVSQVL